MPLEYISDQSSEAPLILMYTADPAHWKSLHEAIQRLLSGKESSVNIHDLPGWQEPAECKLTARLAKRDTGVRQVDELTFECCLTRTWWDNNEGLVQAFLDPKELAEDRCQFLTVPGGDIEWCISTGRTW